MSANGHAFDCDFLGHLPPAASYQLVELDLTTSQPAVTAQALSHFSKKLDTREKARQARAQKENKYNDRIEKSNTQKFDILKEQVLESSGGFVRRPSNPVIAYLANDEEEKKSAPVVPKKEPTGFIGLDDDEDHGLERAFGFKRKG